MKTEAMPFDMMGEKKPPHNMYIENAARHFAAAQYKLDYSTVLYNTIPFLGMKLSLYSSSTAGNRKANVLPLPVLAAPSRSLNKKI